MRPYSVASAVLVVAALITPSASVAGSDAQEPGQQALDRVDEYIHGHGTAFGIFWVDRAADEIVIQVTDEITPADMCAVTDLLDGKDVRFVHVVNSIAVLEVTQEAINDLLRKHDSRLDGLRALGVDIGDNVITVRATAARLPAIRTFLEERWGPELFRIEAGGHDQNAPGVSRGSRPVDERDDSSAPALTGEAFRTALSALARTVIAAIETFLDIAGRS
jgi:hypothetical protein